MKRLSKTFDEIIIKSEMICLKILYSFNSSQITHFGMWDCSSSQADRLRLLTWGEKPLGCTIPHPMEMMG
jgi:hypothetical protein